MLNLVYVMSLDIFLLFFFSSRRRHTRCSRDWSSDVCSSDLQLVAAIPPLLQERQDFGEDFHGLRGSFAARIDLGQLDLRAGRSEEHTSELQSRLHLVCRLLLEKKKYIK